MMSGSVPLAAARRRYGWRAFGLGVLALALIALVLVAQSPPSLRRGGAMLALILAAMCIGVSSLSLLWAWIVVWPTEKRKLAAAQRIHKQAALPPIGPEPLAPFVMLVGGGLLVGALLWGGLNTVGLVGAPMLWIVAGTINLEVARRVRRIERQEGLAYYETPVTFPFKGDQRLFVQPRPAGKVGKAGNKRRAAAGDRKRRPAARSAP